MTVVGQKILVIGDGENASYYSVHVFDIPTRCWLRLTFTTDGTLACDGALPKLNLSIRSGKWVAGAERALDSGRRGLFGKNKVGIPGRERRPSRGYLILCSIW